MADLTISITESHTLGQEWLRWRVRTTIRVTTQRQRTQLLQGEEREDLIGMHTSIGTHTIDFEYFCDKFYMYESENF